MPYTLRIVFSGLCAFAPNRPLDPSRRPGNDPAEPDSAVVLLRNLLEPVQLRDGSPMPFHIPRVEVRKKNLRDSSTRRIDLLQPSQDPGEDLNHCIFRFEDISFQPLGGAVSQNRLAVENRQVDNLADLDVDALTDEERGSLFWLLKLERAAGGDAFLDDRLLGDLLPSPDDTPLIARIHLGEGTLKTLDLQDGLWVFDRNDQNEVERPLARSLALEIENLEQDVEILFDIFDRREVQTRLVVGPPDGSPNETVEIAIRNQEIEALRGFLGQPRGVTADQECEIYFGLLQTEVPPERQRVPQLASGGVLRIGGCSPTAIERPVQTT